MDCHILDVIDAYRNDPGNPKYAFKHLLFSVTEPQFRMKVSGVSEIMWEEAVSKFQGMKSADRERLWPQLVQGFNDLTQRLKIQDEVIVSDTERLRIIQSNVKMVMRIVEALEGRGRRIPLTKGETELAQKLATITRQIKGSGADLCTKVQNLLTISHVQTNSVAFGGSVHLPVSTKIHEQSLADLHEILQLQTDAIARLTNVLKQDIRHVEIMIAEDTPLKMGIQSELVQ